MGLTSPYVVMADKHCALPFYFESFTSKVIFRFQRFASKIRLIKPRWWGVHSKNYRYVYSAFSIGLHALFSEFAVSVRHRYTRLLVIVFSATYLDLNEIFQHLNNVST